MTQGFPRNCKIAAAVSAGRSWAIQCGFRRLSKATYSGFGPELQWSRRRPTTGALVDFPLGLANRSGLVCDQCLLRDRIVLRPAPPLLSEKVPDLVFST